MSLADSSLVRMAMENIFYVFLTQEQSVDTEAKALGLNGAGGGESLWPVHSQGWPIQV